MPHNLPRVLDARPVTPHSTSRPSPIVLQTQPVGPRTWNAPTPPKQNPFLIETNANQESKQICSEFIVKNKALTIENETLKIKISQLLEAIGHEGLRTRIDARAGADGFQQPLHETIQSIPSGPRDFIEHYKLKLMYENQELNKENVRLRQEKERLRQEWVKIKNSKTNAPRNFLCT